MTLGELCHNNCYKLRPSLKGVVLDIGCHCVEIIANWPHILWNESMFLRVSSLSCNFSCSQSFHLHCLLLQLSLMLAKDIISRE